LDRFMEVLNLVVVRGKCCRIYPHQRCRSISLCLLICKFSSSLLLFQNTSYS
jgi:hypothetical protein